MRWVEAHARLLDRSRDTQTLTPSQALAAATIAGALDIDVPYLNLWGPYGVGKTFLAHHLAQKHQGLYLSSPEQSAAESPEGKWLCVDNVPSTRSDARAVYSRLAWQQATAVLIVTQSPLPDSVFRVQLQLNEDDLRAVHSTASALFRNVNLPEMDVNSASLWMLVRSFTTTDQRAGIPDQFAVRCWLQRSTAPAR